MGGISMLMVADATGIDKVTLDEYQGRGSEHLRKRLGRLSTEGQVEEESGKETKKDWA